MNRVVILLILVLLILGAVCAIGWIVGLTFSSILNALVMFGGTKGKVAAGVLLFLGLGCAFLVLAKTDPGS